MRQLLAANPQHTRPADTLTQLANDSNPNAFALRPIALDPNAPACSPIISSSDEAAAAPDVLGLNVLAVVALNPSTPADTLSLLANDPSQVVRDAVAANPSTPTDTLTQLANDPQDPGACSGRFESQHTSRHTLFARQRP